MIQHMTILVLIIIAISVTLCWSTVTAIFAVADIEDGTVSLIAPPWSMDEYMFQNHVHEFASNSDEESYICCGIARIGIASWKLAQKTSSEQSEILIHAFTVMKLL